MRPKAKFNGGLYTEAHTFSKDTRAKLRELYPYQADTCPTFGHPADEFVEVLLMEGYWLASSLGAAKQFLTKEEARAECDALLKDLRSTRTKLQNLSGDFDRLLGEDADPRGCADSITLMIKCAESARCNIDLKKDQARKPVEWQHYVALDFAGRIAIVLRDYEIKPSATASTYTRMVDITQDKNSGIEDTSEYVSCAVKILKIIADDVGLVLAESTWRDTLAEATRQP